MLLRDYQLRAADAVITQWQDVQSTCVVHATGLGKTRLAAEIIDRMRPKRALFMAHQRKLIYQAKAAIEKITGLQCDVEMGEERASNALWGKSPVVIASVQTQFAMEGRRLFHPNDFGLLIVDELHHYVGAPAFQGVVEHYKQNPDLKILGLTATPKRTDQQAIGQIFDSVADVYEIQPAIKDGWLVEIVQQFVPVDTLDYSHVRTTAGDLNGADLAAVMEAEQVEQGMILPILELSFGVPQYSLKGLPVSDWGNFLKANGKARRSIIFCTSIKQAETFANIINRAVEGTAAYICERTPEDERNHIYKSFAEGTIPLVSNVDILGEGYDCLDSETEILTPSGWKGMGQIATGDTMYAFETKSGGIDPVPVQRYVERPLVSGEQMFSIKSQHVDIRTSEGHKFWIRTNGVEQFCSGKDIASRAKDYALPLCGWADFPGLPLTDDELRFIAWFMTDGSMNRSRLTIAQAKQSGRSEIRALLNNMGLDYKSRVRTNRKGFGRDTARPLEEFMIPKGTHHGSMKRRGYFSLLPYLDKNVSPLLHSMNRGQFSVFWEEMLKGDGSIMSGRSGWLHTSRKSNADAWSQMAVLRGFAVSVKKYHATYSGLPMYRVGIRDKRWITSDPTDFRAAKIRLEPSAGETVWCVTNRLSTLIARRNGKVCIIGNCPAVEFIFMARPTKSLSKYTQFIGRGTRPLPGVVDGLGLPDERRSAIAASAKPRVTIVDFVGNSGIHKLVSSFDILGGETSEEALERAVQRAKKQGGPVSIAASIEDAEEDLRAEMEARKRDEEARKARLVAKSNYKTVTVNPFDVLDIKPAMARGWDEGKRLSEKQRAIIVKMGLNPDQLSYAQARQLIGEQFRRWEKKLCTFKQAAVLKKRGIDAKDMTMKEASAILDALARNGWRRGPQVEEVISAGQAARLQIIGKEKEEGVPF